MSEKIVKTFLLQRAETAERYMLEEHLNLISKNVKLLGVEGHDLINYDSWAAQCTHEFSEKVLIEVEYQNTLIITSNNSTIRFNTYEYLITKDNNKHKNLLDITIQQESDGQWRVTKEHLISSNVTTEVKN